MSTSAIPDLIDALIELAAAALPEHKVTDGIGVSGDSTPNVLMIGVEDPDVPDMETSADSEQEAATMGTGRARDELGNITCAADSWNGEGDQRKARRDAFATVATVEDLIRSTPKLGLTSYAFVNATVRSHQLLQLQGEGGARALVIFRVGFAARL